MAFNSAEALREAGMISGSLRPELEDFYASLTQQEVEVLISTKSRLDAILPDVEAHAQPWTEPGTAELGMVPDMQCACGAWSGSGSGGG